MSKKNVQKPKSNTSYANYQFSLTGQQQAAWQMIVRLLRNNIEAPESVVAILTNGGLKVLEMLEQLSYGDDWTTTPRYKDLAEIQREFQAA